MKPIVHALFVLSCLVALDVVQPADNGIFYVNDVYNPGKHFISQTIFLRFMANPITFPSFFFPGTATDLWRKFLMTQEPFVDKAGLPYHQHLLDSVEKVEKALIEDHFVNFVGLLRELHPNVTNLIPYVQHDQIRKVHSQILNDLQKLFGDSSSRKTSRTEFHDFVKKACEWFSTV